MTSNRTDAEKLCSVLQLAFDNDRARYDLFCDIVRSAVPEAHAAVLRGSAITGTRYSDGAPFDADGPGTSDLDLTLVGADVLRYYSAFWIPGIHSKPLSDKDPDIAPNLKELRESLQKLVGRPVNFQATSSLVLYGRDVLFGEPHYVVVPPGEEA